MNPKVIEQSFELMNRNGLKVDHQTFVETFGQAMKKGEIYIQASKDRVVGYLRGGLIKVDGRDIFLIVELACIHGILPTFLNTVFTAQEKYFSDFAYYRAKKNRIYLGCWIPGQRLSLIASKGVSHG